MTNYLDKTGLATLWADILQMTDGKIEESAYELPTMSAGAKGGAKLGSGLVIDSDTLSLGNLTQSGNPVDGCALASLDGEGWAEQVQTVGKNLLPDTVTPPSEGTATRTANKLVIDAGSASSNYVYANFANTLSAGTYTFSAIAALNSGSEISIRALSSDGQSAFDIGLLAADGTRRSVTATVPDGYPRLIVYAGKAGSTAGKVATLVEPQLEAGSTATSYEPYSGGVPSPSPEYPQEIKVARGRNLLPNNATSQTINGVTFTVNPDGSIKAVGTATSQAYFSIANISGIFEIGQEYTAGGITGGSNNTYVLVFGQFDGDTWKKEVDLTAFPMTFTAEYADMRCSIVVASGTTINTTFYPQLELGSIPTPYVPYGHVGFDIYDSQSQHVSTIPIPLPLKSDGERWAGGLPDGTADALTVDSAGKWEWTNACEEAVFDGSSDEGWYDGSTSVSGKHRSSTLALANSARKPASSSDIAVFLASHGAPTTANRTYAATNGASIEPSGAFALYDSGIDSVSSFKAIIAASPLIVLFALATPTTESGYVALPLLPNGCTVECPELENVGVSWYIEGLRPVMERIANERAYIEYLIAEAVTS